MDDAHQVRVGLLTLGDPRTMTGGYLSHLRVAALAEANGARLRFVSFPDRRFPLPALSGRRVLRVARWEPADVLLLDSIAAAFLAPWLRGGGRAVPLVGLLHQPPGGIDHGPARAVVQAALDRHAYRRGGGPVLGRRRARRAGRGGGGGGAAGGGGGGDVPRGGGLGAGEPQRAVRHGVRRGDGGRAPGRGLAGGQPAVPRAARRGGARRPARRRRGAGR